MSPVTQSATWTKTCCGLPISQGWRSVHRLEGLSVRQITHGRSSRSDLTEPDQFQAVGERDHVVGLRVRDSPSRGLTAPPWDKPMIASEYCQLYSAWAVRTALSKSSSSRAGLITSMTVAGQVGRLDPDGDRL